MSMTKLFQKNNLREIVICNFLFLIWRNFVPQRSENNGNITQQKLILDWEGNSYHALD